MLRLTAFLFFSILSTHAQEKGGILLRALLHDPVSPVARLYVGKPGGTMLPLDFAQENLSQALAAPEADGSISLFTSDTVDPKEPLANLAATAKIPSGAKSLIAVIVPSGKQSPPYSMVLINDGTRSFPWGGSKALNLTKVDFAIEAGEHKLALPGGKLTDVPEVTKLNENNRAQTNFHYRQGENWLLAAERQMQYDPKLRRIFIIYLSPSAIAPDVLTIVDHRPPAGE